MAMQQVKLGRFENWAQTLDDNGIIVLASFYGGWLDSYGTNDCLNSIISCIAHSDDPATIALSKWFISHLNSDEKKDYHASRRQSGRCYPDVARFSEAQHKMLADLISELFVVGED